MIKCIKCDIEINNKDTKNIGIKCDDGTYICIACNEITEFLGNNKVVKKPIIKSKKKNTHTNSIICPKCKESYNGKKCDKCNFANPLFIRKKK